MYRSKYFYVLVEIIKNVKTFLFELNTLSSGIMEPIDKEWSRRRNIYLRLCLYKILWTPLAPYHWEEDQFCLLVVLEPTHVPNVKSNKNYFNSFHIWNQTILTKVYILHFIFHEFSLYFALDRCKNNCFVFIIKYF